jgi:predicted metal-binding protein
MYVSVVGLRNQKMAIPLPRVHLFVCANRRDASSPLGPGCGAAGEQLFRALKQLVLAQGDAREVWVTETRCLGICPKRGATVAIYPKQEIVPGVLAADAEELLKRVT